SVAAVLPAPTAPPAPVAPAVAVPSRPAAPSLVLPPGEMLVLIKRGQDAIEAGDIAGARLLLTRAAEAGNAHAALLLGTTYDPAALRERKVLGLAGDPQQARFWYERAADLGSTDAGRRLDDLARGR
ncbi:sel1 repeat family protein, partial [Rhodoplanes sp. TEM]|nr:sel1 repeat family protein [Rhodoplanes sp. TEM]